MREWAGGQGKSIVFAPEAPVLHSEWAWDGTRESLESLEGSNMFTQFYRTPEVLLQGMAADNYNLGKPEKTPTWRPASFYLLGGATPWAEFLAKSRFSTRPAPAGAPAGAVTLVGQSPEWDTRLVVDEATGKLLSYEIDVSGSPYARLVVDRFEQSRDGRVFPSLAHLTIYHKEKPYQFMTLTADRITFDPGEVSEAMRMVLPAGTTVHDRILNRVLPIRRPTPVEAILADQVTPEPEDGPSVLDVLPTPAQATVSLPSESSGREWIWGLSIAVLAAIGLGSLLKGGRMWDRARSSRQI